MQILPRLFPFYNNMLFVDLKSRVPTSGSGRSPGGDHKIWVSGITKNLGKLKKTFAFPLSVQFCPIVVLSKILVISEIWPSSKNCTDFYHIQAWCHKLPYHLCSLVSFCQFLSPNTCDHQVNFKLEFLVQTRWILVNSLNQKFKVHQLIKSRARLRKIVPSSLWRISVSLRVAVRSTKCLWPPSSVKLIMQIFCPLVKCFPSENKPILQPDTDIWLTHKSIKLSITQDYLEVN